MKKVIAIIAILATAAVQAQTLQLSKDGKNMEEYSPAQTVVLNKKQRAQKFKQLVKDSTDLAEMKKDLQARIDRINSQLKICRDIRKKLDK